MSTLLVVNPNLTAGESPILVPEGTVAKQPRVTQKGVLYEKFENLKNIEVNFPFFFDPADDEQLVIILGHTHKNTYTTFKNHPVLGDLITYPLPYIVAKSILRLIDAAKPTIEPDHVIYLNILKYDNMAELLQPIYWKK